MAAQSTTGQVIGLISALWSVGLGDETDRLIEVAVANLSGDEGVALADALREAGREDDALRLYATAPEIVAHRASDEVASLLTLMRRSGRAGDADRLVNVSASARPTVQGTLDLTRALLAAALDGDAKTVLDIAATQLGDDDVVELAGVLRDADRQEAAFLLYDRTAGRREVTQTIGLVDALREAGRPVDSNRLLVSAGMRSAAEIVTLAARLADTDRDRDCERLLAAAAIGPAAGVASLIAALRDGARADQAERVIEIVVARQPASDTAAVTTSLRGLGRAMDAALLDRLFMTTM